LAQDARICLGFVYKKTTFAQRPPAKIRSLLSFSRSHCAQIIMRNLEQHITQYAAYHRDWRNIKTHFVGVPMIVFSAILALAHLHVGPLHMGWPAILLAVAFYLWLDLTLGAVMAILLLTFGIVASLMAAVLSNKVGITLAVLIFIAGWVIQFVGHKYEGMKPAFIDDLMGLAIGPLFIVTEVFFLLGLKPELKKYVEARVGPVLPERNGAPIGPAVSSTTANAPQP
jgi:uncharacterized membrane protein YGL010W